MSLRLSEFMCLDKFFIRGTTRLEGHSFLRRLNLDNVIGQNLGDSFETFKAKDETLDTHLDVIVANCPRDRLLSANIVTWRGILTAIMCHPYSGPREEIQCFNAISLNGVIFIEHDKASQLDRQFDTKFTYYGFRFETIAMENAYTRVKDTHTDNTVEWTHIFSSNLGDISLIYGAEVDGIDDGDDEELVELKTSKVLKTDRDLHFFKKQKLMKTWAQSYLANVPNIVYGFRDEEGIVVETKRYRLQELPTFANGTGWDPNLMVNFLKEYLSKVKTIVSMQPGIVFRITLDPSRKETHPIIRETKLSSFVHLT